MTAAACNVVTASNDVKMGNMIEEKQNPACEKIEGLKYRKCRGMSSNSVVVVVHVFLACSLVLLWMISGRFRFHLSVVRY